MQINLHAWRLTHPPVAAARPEPPLPAYRLPVGMIARAAFAAARHRPRDAWQDTLRLAAGMRPQPDVTGIDNVPASGPCVIVPNHYERTGGVWVGWGAIVMSAALARRRPGTPPIRWVMTNTWADCYLGRWRVPPEYLAWVLRGLASVYGLILMPAHDLPNHDAERLASGLALREVFRGIRRGHVVAFHPEAGGFQTLIRPPRGSGRVLMELDRRGIPCVPAGVFERDGRLTVRFGAALPQGCLIGLDDAQAADRVMREIAALVPAAARGIYADVVDDIMPVELPA
jgi:1-acyl-sn-glycerol-3-phosphate acyltransferase